ncbi:MAG: FAD-binding protein [Thermoplasmata archaeon]|nr:FAD-binding protein [Thermoplasmata archaeon]
METIDTDLVILGSGVAGLRAAIEFARPAGSTFDVAIVSKVQVMRSHSVAPEGGVAAVLGASDSFEQHGFDTVKGSDYLADQDAVEAFVAECPNEVLQLEHWGMPWLRDPAGELLSRRFGAHEVARSFFAYDRTGFFLMKTLYDRVLTEHRVSIFHEFFATAILLRDGRFGGLIAMERKSGKFVLFRARALIVATGGLGRIYSYATYSHTVTGDGLALAFHAGLALKDMEFIQWLPTTLVPSGIPATEALRGDGAVLLNKHGERFLKRYAPKRMELAARDVVVRSMLTEIAQGNGVEGPRGVPSLLLDARSLGEPMIAERYKSFRENAIRFLDLDPVQEPIPVLPGMHFSMGGIDVLDLSMATEVPGIWAAGEAACVSLHGANRLGTNSLPACLVTGKWAAQGARRYLEAEAGRRSTPSAESEEVAASLDRSYGFVKHEGGDTSVYAVRNELQRVMDENVGAFRTREGLTHALASVRRLRSSYPGAVVVRDKSSEFNLEWVHAHEVANLLALSETVILPALWRNESRGSHFRVDHPTRDDSQFLAHSLTRAHGSETQLSSRPARLTKWAPRARTY